AAQMDHVIGPTQDAALQAHKAQAAGTRPWIGLDHVPGPIPQERTAAAAKGRQNQFTRLTAPDRLAGCRLDNVGNTFCFQQMQTAGIVGALNAERADLGHSVVIENTRTPYRLDATTGCGDAAARFTGNDEHPYR